jgi:transcriptional regulator with XRE-family HTH domain
MSRCVVTVGGDVFEPHRLYRARVEAGLSQAEAARAAGMTQRHLNECEHFRVPFTTDEIRFLEALYKPHREQVSPKQIQGER